MPNIIKTVIFSLLLVLIFGCKKDADTNALSSEKSVLQFTASNPGVSSLPVKIDQAKHWIKVIAACPTYQGEIKVTVSVSEKATCSLVSGTVLDLHGTKKFTVTAEDGSQEEYSVFVQGCSIYSSFFYRNCNIKRQMDCLVQDNTAASVDGSAIFLSFQELPDAQLPENDYRVELYLANDNWVTGSPVIYEINPLLGQGSKASFTFSANTFFRIASPAGSVSITHIDTENRLVSGAFAFGQYSDDSCAGGLNTDYIAGEFYSVPC